MSAPATNTAAQQVTYTSGTPPPPKNPQLTATAYDPNGFLPRLGWNVKKQQWK